MSDETWGSLALRIEHHNGGAGAGVVADDPERVGGKTPAPSHVSCLSTYYKT